MSDPIRPPVRVLPARPDLNQLKHQAKELLGAFRAGEPAALAEVRAHFRGAQPLRFALHEAQLVLARAYGFDSWPQLKAAVEGGGRKPPLRPVELQTVQADDLWNTILAASAGDVATLRQLLARSPRLATAAYWYSPVLHFAVRGGHADAVRLLLDAGADPESNGLNDRTLIEMARERGYTGIVTLLEQARDVRGRLAKGEDHAVHRAAGRGDLTTLRQLLTEDPTLANRASSRRWAPLHYAVSGGRPDAVDLLLEHGANLHVRSPNDGEPIDFALFDHTQAVQDLSLARHLVARGATFDLTVAASFGDLAAVRAMLDAAPARIAEARPGGARPLSAAVRFGRHDVVALLLERGVDPRWPEPDAPHGICLHWAARGGDLAMVKLLLDHGADPNEDIDSTSPPAVFAATPGIRALIESRGAVENLYEPQWIDNPALVRQIAANQEAHAERIGIAFVMNAGDTSVLKRMLKAGLRMPDVHTSCQGYLLKPDALKLLLASGMSPDQMNWQRQTLLHHAAAQDDRKCAALLLDAGADLTARDDEYRSTPLAWAARANMPRMVAFLLSRGAPLQLPDDPPDATPLAWARRRGFTEVVEILQRCGANR